MRVFIIVGIATLSFCGRGALGVTIHRTFTTEQPVKEALVWTGASFFATGFSDGAEFINEFDLDGNLISSFASPTDDGQLLPRGLAYDGTSLWIFKPRRRQADPSMFYELDPANGNVLSSFEAPMEAGNIFGLAFDGSNLVGTTGSQIVQVDRNGQLTGTLATNTQGLMGLGHDGSAFVAVAPTYPVAPLNQAWLRIDPVTGLVNGVDSRGNQVDGEIDKFAFHVFAYMGNDRWLFRKGTVSSSSLMAEGSFEFESPIPEPPAPEPPVVPEPGTGVLLAISLVVLGGGRRRRTW